MDRELENAPDSQEESSAQTESTITEEQLLKLKEILSSEQDYIAGILFGLGASVLGAVLWATITVTTKYQIGYMAIGVGFMVGYAVRYGGRGIDTVFGAIGAFYALFGCVLGNYLSTVVFIAMEYNLGYWQTLTTIPITEIPFILGETFQVMNLLFYGFAIYEGYKFSFRVIKEDEIQAVTE